MKKTVFLLPVLLLSACGFQPMYGSYAPGADTAANGGASSASLPEANLNAVEIDTIPTAENEDARYGQALRNELIDRFYKGGTPANTRYLLKFSELRIRERELDLTKNSEATRAQLRSSAVMTLIDKATGETLVSRGISSISSYNILPSKFATRVTEQNARDNTIIDLARQAELQLNLYFNR